MILQMFRAGESLTRQVKTKHTCVSYADHHS